MRAPSVTGGQSPRPEATDENVDFQTTEPSRALNIQTALGSTPAVMKRPPGIGRAATIEAIERRLRSYKTRPLAGSRPSTCPAPLWCTSTPPTIAGVGIPLPASASVHASLPVRQFNAMSALGGLPTRIGCEGEDPCGLFSSPSPTITRPL